MRTEHAQLAADPSTAAAPAAGAGDQPIELVAAVVSNAQNLVITIGE